MKKILLTSLVAAMAFAGAAWAVDWTSTDNVAAGKDAYASSARGSNPVEGLTDGVGNGNGSMWQAVGTQEGGLAVADGRQDWVYVDLGKTYQITSVAPSFGDCAPVNFSVYGTNDNPAGTWTAATWTKLGNAAGQNNAEVEVSVSNTGAFRYVGLVVDEMPGLAEQWGTNINELRVSGNVKLSYDPELTTLNALASATTAFTNQSVQLAYKVLDQEGSEFDGADVAWQITPAEGAAVVDNKFTASAAGNYSIVAVATAGSKTVRSEALTIQVTANVAQGKSIVASEGFAHPERATDGNWNGAQAGGDGDALTGYLVIDLEAAHTISGVTLNWNWMAYAKNFTVGVAAELDGEYTTVVDVKDQTLASEQDKVPFAYAFEAVEGRFVKLAYDGLSNDAWGAQLYQIAVDGVKIVHDDAALQSVTLSASASAAYVGETVSLTALFNDQYGAAIEVSEVEWYVSPEGASVDGGVFTATAEGVYTVSVTADGVQSNEVTLTVTVDPNVAKGAAVSITNEDGSQKTGAAITDGNTGSFAEAGGVPNDGSEGTVANILVDLGGHYDLTGIEVFLGEFYPTKFAVSVSADGEAFTQVAVQDVSENNAHFSFETEAEGIQYVKLSPLSCDNPYNATRVSEIKVFGTLAASDKLALVSEAGGVATYKGVWVAENFDASTAAGEVDLTAVASLPDALPATANANALYYVTRSAASDALRAQANVVTVDGDNFQLKNLVVEDALPLSFTKAARISVENGTVKRTISAGDIAAIYLPFGIKNEGAVMTYFPAGGLQSNDGVTILGFGTNGADGVLGAYVPAVLWAQADITELKSAGAFTLEVRTNEFESVLTASRDFTQLTGAAVADGYGLRESEGKFVKLNGTNTVEPFHSFIAPQATEVKSIVMNLNGILTAINGIGTNGSLKSGAVYNLAGQRVSKAQQGIFVAGGRKVVVK